MGWIAVVAGSGPLLAGTTRFLGFGLVPYPLLYGGFVIPLSIWLAAMGIFMWRRTQTAKRPAVDDHRRKLKGDVTLELFLEVYPHVLRGTPHGRSQTCR